MGPVGRGYTIARKEGWRELLSAAKQYIYRNARKRYWGLSKSATLTAGDIRAEFGTDGRTPHSLQMFERGERDTLVDILAEVTPTDTFWDVGANIGYYSCFVGQRANVVAFEPSPLVAERCRRNLALNNVRAPVHEVALSDHSRVTTLDPGIVARAESGPVEVRTERGDRVAQDVTSPTVVKMDVEGTELEAIEGMEKTLQADRCRLFYCEVHTGQTADRKSLADYGETLDSFIYRVEDMGFEVEMLKERDEEAHIKAKKGDATT